MTPCPCLQSALSGKVVSGFAVETVGGREAVVTGGVYRLVHLSVGVYRMVQVFLVSGVLGVLPEGLACRVCLPGSVRCGACQKPERPTERRPPRPKAEAKGPANRA